MNTATQRPMTDVFDLGKREWTYTATASDFLKVTQLPIPANKFADNKVLKPLHDVVWWAEHTKEFDFSVEDNLKDPDKFNRITSAGVMGDNVPYPSTRSGADLRNNRAELLSKYKLAHRPSILAGR
jgi:hypothetical protein